MLTHTAACIRRREARDRARANWRAKWANHCRGCDGNTCGSNPCMAEGCLYGLGCPRCGKPDAMDEEDARIPCQFCGWEDGGDEPGGDGIPAEYECQCRVAKLEFLARELNKRQFEARAIDAQITQLQRQKVALR